MARPLRIVYPGAFYHITARGNERKDIFLNDRDREKFLSYLASATERYGAVIHVYCLMGNHYHLLIETPAGNLSEIMRHINGAYTTYFNIKRDRLGHLLQGRYRAILVDVDEYAEELSRYIHLNPVRAGVAASPEEYFWSSYQDYIGQRKSPEWLRKEFVLSLFGKTDSSARKKYRKFVESSIGQEVQSPLSNVMHSTFLGGQEFVNRIKENHVEGRISGSDIPALKNINPKPLIDEIDKGISNLTGLKSAVKRQVSIYLCQCYSGKKLKEIGDYFRIGESGVSQAAKRVKAKMEADRKFRRLIEKVSRDLNMLRVKN